MKKIATIVDYGLGNIVSAQQSFLKVVQDNSLHVDVIISRDPEKIKSSSYIVLPGQGAFQSCMDGLNNKMIFNENSYCKILSVKN